jgi:hypothetical protein
MLKKIKTVLFQPVFKRNNKIELVSLILLIGFVAAVFFHYILGAYFNLGHPYNSFLFTPADKFNDFFNSIRMWYQYLVLEPNPYTCYFPLTYGFINIFRFIKPDILSLSIFLSLFVLFFVWYAWQNLKLENKIAKIKNVFIYSFLSFPVLFAIDRANFENFVFIFMALFIFFYVKKNYFISTIFLALAIAMKLFPAVFLILFFTDKKYKEIIYTLIITILSTVVTLIFFQGSIMENILRMIQNQGLNAQMYAIGHAGLNYGHSLFGFFKVLIAFFIKKADFVYYLQLYVPFILILFTCLILYIIFVEKQFWKKVAILVFAMCFFTPYAGDYKLMHLFIPLYLFINDDSPDKYNVIYTILFALLLIPKNYLSLVGIDYIYGGVLLDPLLMLIFLALILYNGFKQQTLKVLLANSKIIFFDQVQALKTMFKLRKL